MPEVLSARLLSRAGLPPDWMTLFVGWLGIESATYRTAHLPFDDVQTFAIDQLAVAAGTRDEWDVFRIADAAPLWNGAAVADIFRGLAERTGISESSAIRKWRYAVIRDDLLRIEGGTVREIIRDYTKRDDWIYRGDHLYDLLNDWGGVCAENPPPDITLEFDEEPVRANFAAARTWLSGEHIAIIGST